MPWVSFALAFERQRSLKLCMASWGHAGDVIVQGVPLIGNHSRAHEFLLGAPEMNRVTVTFFRASGLLCSEAPDVPFDYATFVNNMYRYI